MEEKKAEEKTEEKEEKTGEKQETKEEKPHDSQTNNPAPVKKKLNVKRLAIVIIVILAIVLIVFFVTNNPFNTQKRSEVLTLSYTVSVEGEAIEQDTGNFTSGFIASKLGFITNKLDEEVKNMNVGQEKTINLEPEDAYGEYNDLLVEELERVQKTERETEINRTTEVTVDRFKEIFNEEPILNEEYEVAGVVWKYKVTEVDEDNVKVQAQAKKGDEIPYQISGINWVVTSVDSEKIIARLQGEEQSLPLEWGELEVYFDNDYIYLKANPYTDREIILGAVTGYVTELTEETIYIDGNHLYAGKTVTIDVKLDAKSLGETLTTKQKIPGAPTMQVFIMSYCPYGIQMLKGLLPMWKEFDDKANIELRFVGYTMHGQKEEDENYRIICIREEQYSKLIPYLECFSDKDDPLGCMEQAGIDKDKAEECMASRAVSYFEQDQQLNELYGVQGSPTTIIDGEEAEIYPRSPQDIANALCAAFDEEPSECSLTFSTANPSPGFGGGTSSSSTAAQC